MLVEPHCSKTVYDVFVAALCYLQCYSYHSESMWAVEYVCTWVFGVMRTPVIAFCYSLPQALQLCCI